MQSCHSFQCILSSGNLLPLTDTGFGTWLHTRLRTLFGVRLQSVASPRTGTSVQIQGFSVQYWWRPTFRGH